MSDFRLSAWIVVAGLGLLAPTLGGCAYGPQTPANAKLETDSSDFEAKIKLEWASLPGETTSASTNSPSRTNETAETVARFRDFDRRYDFDAWLQAHPKLPSTAIFMSLSGGGLRAATLAQSVLVALSQYKVPGETDLDGKADGDHSLADDVVAISAASGGATIGTAFALGHVSGIDEQSVFAADFLKSSLAQNTYQVLWPWNWHDRTRPYRAFYDAHVSGGKTYHDLTVDPRSPFLILNSADIASGRNFTFTQQSFSDLCSDLMKLPLADAIDAAGNFPYIETALTLRNYRAEGGCAQTTDDHETTRLREYLHQPYGDLFYVTAARYWLDMRAVHQNQTTLDEEGIPRDRLIQWLHLYDGGLADNLGLRPLTEILIQPQTLARLYNRGVRRIAVIVVNARSDETKVQYHQSASPYLFENWNEDTENLMVETSYGPIDRVTALNEYATFPLIDKIFYEGCAPPDPKQKAAGKGVRNAPSKPETGELAPCSFHAYFPAHLYPIIIDFDQMSETVRVKSGSGFSTIPLPDIIALREHVKNISTQDQLHPGKGYVVPPDLRDDGFDDTKAVKSAGRMLLGRNPCFKALLGDIGRGVVDYKATPSGLDGVPGDREKIWSADAAVYQDLNGANNLVDPTRTPFTGRTEYTATCIPLEVEKIHEFKITTYPGTHERTLKEQDDDQGTAAPNN